MAQRRHVGLQHDSWKLHRLVHQLIGMQDAFKMARWAAFKHRVDLKCPKVNTTLLFPLNSIGVFACKSFLGVAELTLQLLRQANLRLWRRRNPSLSRLALEPLDWRSCGKSQSDSERKILLTAAADEESTRNRA